MEFTKGFPTAFNWTSPFSLLCGIFHFDSNFNMAFCKYTEEILIRRCAASGLVLHCLHIFHKKDARLLCGLKSFFIPISERC